MLLAAALVAAFIVPGVAEAKPGCHGHACFERVAANKCSNAQPRWCVERAIITYQLTGWQVAWMRRIPGCESGWNPLAYFPSKIAETPAERAAVDRAGTSAGLYGFIGSTWESTPYASKPRWLAKWSALAAAWMVRVGRAPGEWSCR